MIGRPEDRLKRTGAVSLCHRGGGLTFPDSLTLAEPCYAASADGVRTGQGQSGRRATPSSQCGLASPKQVQVTLVRVHADTKDEWTGTVPFRSLHDCAVRRSVSTTMPATSTLSGVTLLVQQGGHHASRSLYSRALRLLRLIPDAMLDLAAPRIVRLHERIAMRMGAAANELRTLESKVDRVEPSEGSLDLDGSLCGLLIAVEADIVGMAADVGAMLSTIETSMYARWDARREALLGAMRHSLASLESARMAARHLRGTIQAREADVDAFIATSRCGARCQRRAALTDQSDDPWEVQ